MFYDDAPLSAVPCLPACLRVCRSVLWPGPPAGTLQNRSTAAEVRIPACHLGPHKYPNPENFVIDDPLHLPHQQRVTTTTEPHGQPQARNQGTQPGHHPQRHAALGLGPGVSPHWAPGGSCPLVHGDPPGCAPSSLGYQYAWQRKGWRVWRDSRYVADFSPDLHTEDRPAEEPSARPPGKCGRHPGAAPLATSWWSPEDPRPNPPVRCT